MRRNFRLEKDMLRFNREIVGLENFKIVSVGVRELMKYLRDYRDARSPYNREQISNILGNIESMMDRSNWPRSFFQDFGLIERTIKKGVKIGVKK